MVRAAIERDKQLCEFGQGVRDDAVRNLHILRAIDDTLANLKRMQKHLQADADFAEEMAAAISKVDAPEKKIDESGELDERLYAAQGLVEELYKLLLEKQDVARTAKELTEEDGVAEAYTEVVSAAADLHNGLNTLRWAVSEHDAELSAVSGKVHNVSTLDEFFAELES